MIGWAIRFVIYVDLNFRTRDRACNLALKGLTNQWQTGVSGFMSGDVLTLHVYHRVAMCIKEEEQLFPSYLSHASLTLTETLFNPTWELHFSTSQRNALESKVHEAMRLMGLSRRCQKSQLSRVTECSGLNKIKANINLMVQQDERIETM